MSCVIIMAGKGGTGKTTIAALIVRIIKENKLGSILAVDADPNSNLAEVLGLETKESIGQILDEISAHPEVVPVNVPAVPLPFLKNVPSVEEPSVKLKSIRSSVTYESCVIFTAPE